MPWGNNESGQLVDGTTTTRKAPVQVPGLTGVTVIASGDYHNIAVKNDGTVWVWGSNGDGALGLEDELFKSYPVWVLGSIMQTQNLMVTITGTSVTLTWPAASNATGYDVEADGAVINNGTNTMFVHSGLLPNTTHIYRFRVKDVTGPGDWSDPLTVWVGTPVHLYNYDSQNRLNSKNALKPLVNMKFNNKNTPPQGH